MFERIQDVTEFLDTRGIRSVDLKFSNLFGGWHHVTVPASRMNEELMKQGVGFDASSTPGFKSVDSGDMILVPDLSTGFVDPFPALPTLSFLADIHEADTREAYHRDPRSIARRAESYLKATGFADESRWAPEFEFYVFDELQYANTENIAYYELSYSGYRAESLNRGRVASGVVIPAQGGYHALPPADQAHDLRDAIMRHVEEAGIGVRYHHHEVGAMGQQELELMGGPLLRMGDVTLMVKYFVRMAAHRQGRHATFMPKPIYDQAGSGMHFHQHLFDGGRPLFYDGAGYGGLSKLAHHYVAGILEHAPALLAFTNPSTNSFKRLVPGFEAPVNAFFSLANRSAAVRIPKYATEPETKRIEFRPPDATCNPYLAMSAMLMAGIDGIKRELDPGERGFGPYDGDMFHDSMAEVRDSIQCLPESLDKALDALEEDHDFLLQGGVFASDILESWIDYKRDREIRELRRRPHPYEIELYFNV